MLGRIFWILSQGHFSFTPVTNFNVWLHTASIPDQALTVRNHVELLWKLRHYAYYLKPHQQNPKTTRAQVCVKCWYGDVVQRHKHDYHRPVPPPPTTEKSAGWVTIAIRVVNIVLFDCPHTDCEYSIKRPHCHFRGKQKQACPKL